MNKKVKIKIHQVKSITYELNKLNKLHSDGVLNIKQFEAAKKKY